MRSFIEISYYIPTNIIIRTKIKVRDIALLQIESFRCYKRVLLYQDSYRISGIENNRRKKHNPCIQGILQKSIIQTCALSPYEINN